MTPSDNLGYLEPVLVHPVMRQNFADTVELNWTPDLIPWYNNHIIMRISIVILDTKAASCQWYEYKFYMNDNIDQIRKRRKDQKEKGFSRSSQYNSLRHQICTIRAKALAQDILQKDKEKSSWHVNCVGWQLNICLRCDPCDIMKS